MKRGSRGSGRVQFRHIKILEKRHNKKVDAQRNRSGASLSSINEAMDNHYHYPIRPLPDEEKRQKDKEIEFRLSAESSIVSDEARRDLRQTRIR